MPFQIACECGKTLNIPDRLVGKKVKCPCGNVLTAEEEPLEAVAYERFETKKTMGVTYNSLTVLGIIVVLGISKILGVYVGEAAQYGFFMTALLVAGIVIVVRRLKK